MNPARLARIGKYFGSEEVAIEASEAEARWARDLARLAIYGHGATVLAAFQTLRAEHARLRAGRPETVAEKTRAVRDRRQAIADAKT